MAAAALSGFAPSAPIAIAAAVLATWATALVQLLLMRRRLARMVEPGPQRYETRSWLAVSLPILMVESFYLLLTYTDLIVLQHFRPPHDVSLYYAAGKTLALVAFVNFAVAAAVAHKFTAYHVSGDRERLKAFLADSIRWTFWPSLAATVLILALGRPFLWMFGAGFVEGYYLMFILAAGLLARAAIGPVERLLNMLGEQRLCALVYAATFVLNLVLCLVLIPRLGVAGAAVATSSALIVESILLFLATRSRLGLHVFIWRGRGKDSPS
jgi:O-antigen/teichoic acid export membrane protein